MYEHAKSLGITLITISLRCVTKFPHSTTNDSHVHASSRPSLTKYHTQLLTLAGDGTGRWTLSQVGTAEERMGLDREIGMLQSKLKEVEKWERRVKDLEVMLGPEGAKVDT